MNDRYAFSNSWEKAADRVTTIENVYDRITRPRLDELRIPRHGRCLEVGAGAGSIARHLAHRVGPDGSVVAVDIDVSLLTDLPANIEVVETDIRGADLPVASFDLVHTRLVLNHVVERVATVRTLLGLVKVGGHILMEEGDVFATDALADDLHGRVMTALWAGLDERGTDVRFGRELPRLLAGSGLLDDVDVTCFVPVCEARSPGVQFMLGSVDQAQQLGLLDRVDATELDAWRELVTTPGAWHPGLGLYQVSGRRSA